MTKSEQIRLARWRMRVLCHARETSQNVSRTCRYFGISRKTFYKWRACYEELGEAGLCDPSRAPRHSPRSTLPDVVRKILYLRQNYHFGRRRIAAYLRRYHAISIAASSVHRILRKQGINLLPANQKHRLHKQRWKRYEKREPGHRLQVDAKFLERIPGTRKRFYELTAIDDFTRIRVLKIYDACNQKTAIQFIDEVMRRLPFRVHVVQTDNGPEFQSKFRWHRRDLDVRHVSIRPRTPRLNGKVERSHRIDDEEFYQLLEDSSVRESIHLFNKKLRQWEDYYNFERPHGALDGQTPYERLLQKIRAGVSPLS